MKNKPCFVFEELEVDKVYREDQAVGNEFDELYKEIKKDKTEQSSEGEPSDDVASDNEDESLENAINNETSDDQTETNSDIALESILIDHRDAFNTYLAQEDLFEDKTGSIPSYLGEKTLEGLGFLKRMGFTYGPILLKHVYKGILFALEKTLRALFKGSVSLVKYIKKRVYSYSNFKEKIQSARDVIKLLSDDKDISKSFFTNEVVIQKLLIGNSSNFLKNTVVFKDYFTGYFSIFSRKVDNHITGVNRLIENIISTNGNYSSEYYPSENLIPGLSEGLVSGFRPTSTEVNTFASNQLLPGNIKVIAFLPKPNLRKREEIVSSLAESKIFLGVDVKQVIAKKQVNFLSKRDLLSYLDILEEICDCGIGLEKTYISIAQKRNGVSSHLKSYMKFIYNLRDKISIHNSMADLISLEVQYLDKTYITSSLQIQDYSVEVLSASLSFIKENIEALS